MFWIVLPNCGGHALRPVAEDVVPRSLRLVKRQSLAELNVTHPTRVPTVRAAGGSRGLVDQIVTKDGGTFGTRFGNGSPVEFLGFPAIFIIQRIVPGHSVVDFVAGETGNH